ncbi:MAG TPA: DUF362 domain-containing protein [Longimicrobium sp.]|uniref:DUF362 domain-containing protein n=1 Tax=Longimicrobium sp. TaxID=2029185 RepID=UPI002ED7A029
MLPPERVFCARSPGAGYATAAPEPAPELPGGTAETPALITLRALLRDAGLDASRYGTAAWNPLGAIIRAGSRVLLKPNWVLHQNQSGHGMECLVTHTSVVEAAAVYALLAGPGQVVIGDAPVQGCDFEALAAACGFAEMLDRLAPLAARQGTALSLVDFRRTILDGGRIEHRSAAVHRGDDDYVLFDMADESALEPVTARGTEFRVTMYDPRALARTHAPGRHQYLIAREAVEADVVINLPKLKTHKKAGVTGALKNLVGINGHKEYLPHHRKGGADRGGDCYPGGSPLKATAEHLLDVANASSSRRVRRVLPRVASLAARLGRLWGHDANLEGSWHGNDTVWRMCLDLQRVLAYGRPDGTLAGSPQRAVLTLTDAIVAGEGNGPLSPLPAPLGMLTLGTSPAALEWVHALLMGFDPRRIPLIHNAFAPHPRPLARFGPEAVRVMMDGREIGPAANAAAYGRAFVPPDGWRGACEAAGDAEEAA